MREPVCSDSDCVLRACVVSPSLRCSLLSTGSQEAVDIASGFSDPNEAAKKLTAVAKKRWAQATGGSMADDITVVVAHLS